MIFAPSSLGADETTEEYVETSSVFEGYCAEDQAYVNETCVKLCIAHNRCGENTECEQWGAATYCSCARGFTGDPLGSCFKLDEKAPCDPNPCGPNAECIPEDDKIGPHCKCLKNFYDWPPNCRPGCESDEQCADDELCISRVNKCEKVCDPSPCGENSVCRVDRAKSRVFCSCLEGFIPERGAGCREKLPSDFEIPIDFISSVIVDPCDEKCGYNAYCGEGNNCMCTQGYTGDPLTECSLDETPTSIDPCSPNPCGSYSTCDVIDGKENCSCIDGYGTAPYCSACHSTCLGGDLLCVGGRCVENVCSHFCGYSAICNVFNSTLECGCRSFEVKSQPFSYCHEVHFFPPNVIATLLG